MNKLAGTVILVSVVLGASPFIADELLVEQNQVMDMNMSASVVSSNNTSTEQLRAGVDTGQNMDFGEVSADVDITKFLNINAGDQRVGVAIDTQGNITDRLEYRQSQVVEGDQQIEVKFVPGEEKAYYTGKIQVKTLTPQNSIGQKWLQIRSVFF